MNRPGRDAVAEPQLALVRDLLAGQQADQVRLAGAVRADQADPLAEVDLLLERAHQAVDRDVAQANHDPRRVAAGDPDLDLLVGDGRRRRAGVDEAPPARLGGVGALGVDVADRGPLLHDLVVVEQAPLLALPLLEPVAEQLLAPLARLGIGAVGAAVRPGAARLQRQDRVGRRAEQVAVVADHHDRLLRGRDPPLELQLGGHVEEVVGLVEQQHRRLAGEQHLEHQPLALAARELRRQARPDLVEPGADDPAAGGVPATLELVAAQLGPLADRLAQPHSRARGVGAGGELAVGARASARPPLAGAPARARAAARAPCGRSAPAPTSWAMYAKAPMSTSPSSAGSRPASTRKRVDLPTPLAPTSPTCWPGVMRNDTSENSRSPPGWA